MATIEQMQQALIAADKAGDTQAATAIAQALKQAQAQSSHGQTRQPPSVSPMESFGRGAADTMTMGFGDEGGAALAINPFQGDWPGQYNAKLNQIRSEQQNAQKANPASYLTGQVVGGVAPMVVPGLNVARAASLGGTMARGALSGAATGALYGFGSGNSFPERFIGAGEGATFGGLTGGAVPVAGRAVSAALPYLSGAPTRAVTAFGRAASADNVGTPYAMGQALMALGPDAIPADLGPNLQRQAGALASLPGEAQTTVRGALTTRDAAANARIGNEVNAAIGPAPVPSVVDKGIVDSQRALDPEYATALGNATRVNTAPIALMLDSQSVNLRGAAQKAVQDVRKMLNVTDTDQLDPNPGTLLETRKAIDGKLATETDPNAIRVLVGARQMVDQELAASAPGIKQVDAKFAELARQREALTRGQQALDSGRTAPRPQELADELAKGAVPQGAGVGPSAVPFRLAQGTRAEIDRIIGTNSNDVVALNKMIKGEGSWNRDRLATLFGPNAADRIIALVDRERSYAATSSVVRTNSETAARLAAQKEVAPPPVPEAGVVRSLFNVRPGDAAAHALSWFTGGRAEASRAASNSDLAQLLVTPAAAAGRPDPVAVALAAAAKRRALAAMLESGTNQALFPVGRGLTAAFTNTAQGR